MTVIRDDIRVLNRLRLDGLRAAVRDGQEWR